MIMDEVNILIIPVELICRNAVFENTMVDIVRYNK